MDTENRDLVLSHEDSVRIMKGLSIPDENAIFKRNQILNEVRTQYTITEDANGVTIDIPDLDLSFIDDMQNNYWNRTNLDRIFCDEEEEYLWNGEEDNRDYLVSCEEFVTYEDVVPDAA